MLRKGRLDGRHRVLETEDLSFNLSATQSQMSMHCRDWAESADIWNLVKWNLALSAFLGGLRGVRLWMIINPSGSKSCLPESSGWAVGVVHNGVVQSCFKNKINNILGFAFEQGSLFCPNTKSQGCCWNMTSRHTHNKSPLYNMLLRDQDMPRSIMSGEIVHLYVDLTYSSQAVQKDIVRKGVPIEPQAQSL